MDVTLIELLLWGCLLLFFWAMKDGLNNVESDIESRGWMHEPGSARLAQRPVQYCHPQTFLEPIGSYRDKKIYRYAVIDDQIYRFDRVCPPECKALLNERERCVEPGLVYRACDAQEKPAIPS